MPKNIINQGGIFSKIVKQTGYNNCEQGGKKPQNS